MTGPTVEETCNSVPTLVPSKHPKNTNESHAQSHAALGRYFAETQMMPTTVPTILFVFYTSRFMRGNDKVKEARFH